MNQLSTIIEAAVKTEARQAVCGVQWFLVGSLPKIWVCAAQIQHEILLLVRNSLESVSEVNFSPKKLHIHVNYTHQEAVSLF